MPFTHTLCPPLLQVCEEQQSRPQFFQEHEPHQDPESWSGLLGADQKNHKAAASESGSQIQRPVPALPSHQRRGHLPSLGSGIG